MLVSTPAPRALASAISRISTRIPNLAGMSLPTMVTSRVDDSEEGAERVRASAGAAPVGAEMDPLAGAGVDAETGGAAVAVWSGGWGG